jgi:membrane-bound lytic murein transglycosylase B
VEAAQNAALLEFAMDDGKESWLTFANFGAITKYNNSTYYAMSVFQLATAVKAAFREAQ